MKQPRCHFCLSTEHYSNSIPYFAHYHICPECAPHIVNMELTSLKVVLSKSSEDYDVLLSKISMVATEQIQKEKDMFNRSKTRAAAKEEIKKETEAFEKVMLKDLKQRLKDSVMDQDHVIDSTYSKLLVHFLATEKKKPLSLFFAGPTGVGKTELTEKIAYNLNIDYLKFDMSEYKHSHQLSRLIGSPPSYVGYGKPVALEKLHKRKGVILFDEIEKAHDDVYDVFLQLLDKGVITTGSGKELDLKDCVVVFTSNLGVNEVKSQGKTVGFVKSTEDSGSIYKQSIENHFRPEMVNRFDEVLVFNSLSKTGLDRIFSKFESELNARLYKAHGVSFEVSDTLKAKILEEGFNPAMGARPLLRTMEKWVMATVAEHIILEDKENSLMVLDLVDGKTKVVETRANSKEEIYDFEGMDEKAS